MAQFLNLKAILSLNGSGFALGLKQADSASKKFANDIKGEFARAFGTAAITAYATKIVNLADNIIDLSERLGVSAQVIQEWGHAARRSGSSIEAVTRFLEQLAVARDKALGGDEGTLKNLDRLGVTDLSSVEAMARQIATTVQNSNIQDILAPLRDIGGRGVGELVPFLKAMREMEEAARKSGQVMSNETLVALKNLKTEALGLADIFLGPVADSITFITRQLENVLSFTKMTVGSFAAYHGAKAGGATDKEAREIAYGVIDSEVDAREKRKKAIQAQIERLQSTGTAEDAPKATPDVLHRVALKNVAEKAARREMRDQSKLNSWQQLGAAVRFSPENHGQEIAKNTSETVRKLEETKAAIEKMGTVNGLGGDNGF